MFSVDAPRGADEQPVLPAEVWAATPLAAQGLIVALLDVARQVTVLAAANARLEARVRDLEVRLGQNSSNSSRPPSSDPPQAPRRPAAPPTGRARGGQPGHVAHQRAVVPPERIDQIVNHRPATCRHCMAPLSGATVSESDGEAFVAHHVTEVPPVRALVTEHRLHQVRCPACGQATRALLPPDVSAGAFGPRLQATVAVLSGQYRLSRRQVADVCGTVLDAPLAASSVAGLCQATAVALATPVAALQATLPAAPVANADETRWPHAGQTQWLWVVVTGLATVFTIAASRGSQVIKDLLGEDYGGVLGSDRYAGYAWLDVTWRQVCWAHLKRDFQALVDRGGAAQAIGKAALVQVHELFTAWHQFRQGTLDRAGLQQALQPVQDAFAPLLDDGMQGADAKAAGLCAALDRLWPALWTFADEDGVEPTNNAAERALRPAVLWRKGSFGSQSDGGARFVERLLTVTATCRQQGHSVLDYLTAVCTAAGSGQPIPTLPFKGRFFGFSRGNGVWSACGSPRGRGSGDATGSGRRARRGPPPGAASPRDDPGGSSGAPSPLLPPSSVTKKPTLERGGPAGAGAVGAVKRRWMARKL
jgi:transposase